MNNEVVVIEPNVPIDQGDCYLVSRSIARAEADHAAAVIINMNTPGGSLNDMISIVDSISNSTVPVYTYVGNDSGATSAGSYIAMATDKIFMGPGSADPPSTPYILGGGTALEQIARLNMPSRSCRPSPVSMGEMLQRLLKWPLMTSRIHTLML